VPITPSVSHTRAEATEIAVYAVPEERHTRPSEEYPILLSYLDVVVQGYLRTFGAEGALRFFETTDGWGSPILNDRPAPRYPRHQTLTPYETAFVDAQLASLSAMIKHLE